MKDGIIEPDSEFGEEIGFTSDRFDGYLWLEGNEVTISAIWSKHGGRGNFSRLIRTIENKGYTVAIPTPLGKMEDILVKWGFKKSTHFSEGYGDWIDVWRRAV